MIRFVLDPSGCVAPDLGAKLPGRGAWVRATRRAVEQAAQKGAFGRAFKREAALAEGTTPAGLADAVERGLEARSLSALGLARRAGRVATGFEKAREALAAGNAAALLTAADASEDGAQKLARLARGVAVVRGFSTAAQSAALGRPGVTHAVLLAGAEAERFLREAHRLEGFRPVFAAAAVEREM